ncbi:MAG: Ppx/GppA phosphatase family protein [Nitrososphaeraceae archaeon]
MVTYTESIKEYHLDKTINKMYYGKLSFRKVSVIDLGYNSLKLVHYIISPNKSYKKYYEKSIRVKLGEGLNKTGYLRTEAIDRTIESLKYFRDVINSESIEFTIPFATSAVREAENKKLFLKKVEEETGFKFKLLSANEEAAYSYLGALNSLCVSNCLFFDLGGGTIELVSSRDYRIRRVMSLPLGALKLTQKFFSNNEDNKTTISKKFKVVCNILGEHIENQLPDSKELEIDSESTVLMGVGGTLRTIARYDQLIKEYPITRLHNYKLDFRSLSTIKDHLSNMNKEELSKIDVIGANRAETIKTGLYVIYLLMSKFSFKSIIVSTKGLREGVLLNFLESCHLDNRTNLDNYLLNNCYNKDKCNSSLAKKFLSNGIITKNEYTIINQSILYMSKILINDNIGQFYILVNEDIANLDHHQHVILALSLLAINKPKIALELSENYRNLLYYYYDKKKIKNIIERISTFLRFLNFVKNNKLIIQIKEFTKITNKLLLEIVIQGDKNKDMFSFPEILFKEIMSDFKSAFDLSIQYTLLVQDKKWSTDSK